MTEEQVKENFSLAELRQQELAARLPAIKKRVIPKRKPRRGLSFWLHIFVGAMLGASLTIHGLVANGNLFSINKLPLFWLVSTLIIGFGTYSIRRALVPEGGVIPRRAARAVWVSFFAVCIFWTLALWTTVLIRSLPSYLLDLNIPVLFLFYLMAKTLERARVAEPIPALLFGGCLAASLTTLWTAGSSNQYFLAASWVGILIIVPHVRQLLKWG